MLTAAKDDDLDHVRGLVVFRCVFSSVLLSIWDSGRNCEFTASASLEATSVFEEFLLSLALLSLLLGLVLPATRMPLSSLPPFSRSRSPRSLWRSLGGRMNRFCTVPPSELRFTFAWWMAGLGAGLGGGVTSCVNTGQVEESVDWIIGARPGVFDGSAGTAGSVCPSGADVDSCGEMVDCVVPACAAPEAPLSRSVAQDCTLADSMDMRSSVTIQSMECRKSNSDPYVQNSVTYK